MQEGVSHAERGHHFFPMSGIL